MSSIASSSEINIEIEDGEEKESTPIDFIENIDNILETIIQPFTEEDKINIPRNFSWIVENELAAMGCPENINQLKYLSYKGICHLISLSEEYLPPNIEKYSHLNWLLIPIEEFHAPTLKQVVKFIEFCQNCRQYRQPVGVHCRQGRGRTGVMSACYLIYFHKFSTEKAITTIRLSRPGSIETYRQERIIHEFTDLIRSDNYDNLVKEMFRTGYNEGVKLLNIEIEKKLQLNYIQKESLKKKLKVLQYNTLYCFLKTLRKYNEQGQFWLK